MIKKILILLFVIIICKSGVAQKDSSKYKMKKFITSVEFATQSCYRFIDSQKLARIYRLGYHSSASTLPKESYNTKNDERDFGYIVGVYCNLRLYKNLRFKIGFEFEDFKYQTGLIDTFYVFYDGLYNKYTEKHVKSVKMKYEYQFTSLFIELNYYQRINNKFYFKTGLGFIPSRYHFMQTKKTEGNDERIEVKPISASDITLLLRYNISIGLVYVINKNLSISLEPYFRSAMFYRNNNYNHNSNGLKTYSIGTKLGFNF